jgi:hypothetical protein
MRGEIWKGDRWGVCTREGSWDDVRCVYLDGALRICATWDEEGRGENEGWSVGG